MYRIPIPRTCLFLSTCTITDPHHLSQSPTHFSMPRFSCAHHQAAPAPAFLTLQSISLSSHDPHLKSSLTPPPSFPIPGQRLHINKHPFSSAHPCAPPSPAFAWKALSHFPHSRLNLEKPSVASSPPRQPDSPAPPAPIILDPLKLSPTPGPWLCHFLPRSSSLPTCLPVCLSAPCLDAFAGLIQSFCRPPWKHHLFRESTP